MMLAVGFLYALYCAEADFFYTYFAERIFLFCFVLFCFTMNRYRIFFNFVPIEITI